MYMYKNLDLICNRIISDEFDIDIINESNFL